MDALDDLPTESRREVVGAVEAAHADGGDHYSNLCPLWDVTEETGSWWIHGEEGSSAISLAKNV